MKSGIDPMAAVSTPHVALKEDDAGAGSWDVTAKPSQFPAAIDWFSSRVPLTKPQWKSLGKSARKQGFTVAGVAQMSMVADVHAAMDRAIKAGISFDDFKAAIRVKLEREWLGQGVLGDDGAPKNDAQAATRLQLIFRNGVQNALSAGRWKAATDPEVMQARPYWIFDGIADSRQSKICRRCDGTVLAADDPWWASHNPPLHHSCRSGIITLTDEQASARGLSSKPPSVDAQEGFGSSPSADEWSPNQGDFPSALWANFKAAQRDAAE